MTKALLLSSLAKKGENPKNYGEGISFNQLIQQIHTKAHST